MIRIDDDRRIAEGEFDRPNLPAFVTSDLIGYRPDAFLVLRDGGNVLAHCALWWRETPLHAGQRVGAIGHFAARGAEAGVRILSEACARLAAQGCALAVGPMDGNTWRGYRLVTHRCSEPPFFLEPDNPADWPEFFCMAGFSVAASYCSVLQHERTIADPRIEDVAHRAAIGGIRIRALDITQLERELHGLHALCLAAFSRNFLFTPLGRDEFIAQYSRLRPYLRPELILIAERDDQPVAFLFALPDALEAQRGAVTTAIVKTVAALPGRAYAGLGHVLFAGAVQTAMDIGFTRVIHALMHDANGSLKCSQKYGSVIRRYALYGREL